MHRLLLTATICITAACNINAPVQNSASTMSQPLPYPPTRQGTTVDSYFSTRIADPYRWLEDDLSAETGAWVRAQNKVTFDYLGKIPNREALRQRLENLWNYEKVSAPFTEGDYTYYYRNDGLQNHSVVYRRQGDGPEEVFLDPNTFSEDGTTSLTKLRFSRDGSIAAYAISEGGSDWRKIIVIDAISGQTLGESLTDVKFTRITWKGNDGFFYSSYDRPDGSVLSAKTDQHKVYYHRLGTAQSEDTVVFGATPAQKRRYVYSAITQDDRYLLIESADTTSGNELFIRDLGDSEAKLRPVLSDADSDTSLLDSQGSTLFLLTNRDAPNKKIVRVDASNPGPENWVDVIPETDEVLVPLSIGDYFYAEYMVNAVSRVYRYNRAGERLGELQLPGTGSFSAAGGKWSDDTLYYSFTNYKTPSTLFSIDLASGKSTLFQKSRAKFDSDAYTSTQVFYRSSDGTRVPMIITHKKGLQLDGKNPTILYGYGGFGVSLTPAFGVANAVWLEQGGVYAVPNLRGGGEYGKAWHRAGTLQQKQNVFDDFIAAAEYLIETGYTSSDYLALRGGSNGGLLVGAVMTQRPELAAVALPAVGVLDMLRYHTFTSGAGWAYDYGTAEQSDAMFRYLLGYSPLHNVAADTHYPATLVTTGDHDDRVVPAHSFKFAAELQAKQAGPAPVLIRIETDAGHGAGTSVSKRVEQYADMFAFALFNMGKSR